MKNLPHLTQSLITLTRVALFVCTHRCCYETKIHNHRSREPQTAPSRHSSIPLLDTRKRYLERRAYAYKPTKTKTSRVAVSFFNSFFNIGVNMLFCINCYYNIKQRNKSTKEIRCSWNMFFVIFLIHVFWDAERV